MRLAPGASQSFTKGREQSLLPMPQRKAQQKKGNGKVVEEASDARMERGEGCER
jgi:hypothetical protein